MKILFNLVTLAVACTSAGCLIYVAMFLNALQKGWLV
tara:strand:- start:115 stop:225 length:111 start_codon:yes stop_codon:yes gene_type:complete